MKLEDQVCSLEVARKLKALGVKQESFWSWYDTIDRDDGPRLNRSDENCPVCTLPKQNWEEKISAFTAAELGEMLPEQAGPGFFREKMIDIPTSRYEVFYADSFTERIVLPQDQSIRAATEADARAKMLIYLIENNLLERVA